MSEIIYVALYASGFFCIILAVVFGLQPIAKKICGL